MQEEQLSQKELIAKELDERTEQLNREIELITIRQTEIQAHIHNLENVIKHFKQMIKVEKDPDKRSRFHNVISHNIELLAKLYSVYREFEDTKNKFYKEGNTLVLSKIRITNIELDKIQKEIDDTNILLAQLTESAFRSKNTNPIADSDEVLKDQKYQI